MALRFAILEQIGGTVALETFESTIHMPLMQVPIHSTLITEKNRRVLISPIDFTSAQIQKIRDGGEVTDIVAPSLIHHLFVPAAKKNFPNSIVWGVPGVEEKQKDVQFEKSLTPASWPYSDFLEIVTIEGAPKVKEVVFFYKPLRTLIVTDLCFNLKNVKGLGATVMTKLMATKDGFSVSRLWTAIVKDKKLFSASIQKMNQWDFDKIIVAHGEILNSGGKKAVKEAFLKRGYSLN